MEMGVEIVVIGLEKNEWCECCNLYIYNMNNRDITLKILKYNNDWNFRLVNLDFCRLWWYERIYDYYPNSSYCSNEQWNFHDENIKMIVQKYLCYMPENEKSFKYCCMFKDCNKLINLNLIRFKCYSVYDFCGFCGSENFSLVKKIVAKFNLDINKVMGYFQHQYDIKMLKYLWFNEFNFIEDDSFKYEFYDNDFIMDVKSFIFSINIINYNFDKENLNKKIKNNIINNCYNELHFTIVKLFYFYFKRECVDYQFILRLLITLNSFNNNYYGQDINLLQDILYKS